MTFGLVLGAGGTAGEAFHRGVVRAMTDLGFEPREAQTIVGTSAGSIVAASLRRGVPHAPLEDTAPPVRRRRLPTRGDVLDLARRPRQAVNALLLAPEFISGRISTEFIAETLRRRHGTGWPTSPLWIVAVRRRDGRRVVFGKPGEPAADVASAVAASCAIPGYFRAVSIGGVSYIDGGVHSPTNADLLAPSRLHLVVVSSPMSLALSSPLPRPDSGLRLYFHGYLRNEVWTLRRRGTRVLTVEPDRHVLRAMGFNMMSGQRIDEIEERAYELGRRKLRGVPLELAFHPAAKRLG